MIETRTRGKGTIDRRLRGSMRTLDDMNPTRLSKQSQAVPLQGQMMAHSPGYPTDNNRQSDREERSRKKQRGLQRGS